MTGDGIGRREYRFLERIPTFRPNWAPPEFRADAGMGILIGTLVSPTELERSSTVFGSHGFDVLDAQGSGSIPYWMIREIPFDADRKTDVDVTAVLGNDEVLIVPVGTRGAGSSVHALTLRKFLLRASVRTKRFGDTGGESAVWSTTCSDASHSPDGNLVITGNLRRPTRTGP